MNTDLIKKILAFTLSIIIGVVLLIFFFYVAIILIIIGLAYYIYRCFFQVPKTEESKKDKVIIDMKED